MSYRFWKTTVHLSIALAFASLGSVAWSQDAAKPATPATPTTPAAQVKPATPEQAAAEAEILKASKQLIDGLNNADVDAVLSMFLADAELIDDSGTVFLGHEELKTLFKTYFETFQGSKTVAEIESIRLVGGLALVDGTRVISGKDGKDTAVLRFATVWKKTDAGYKLASLRDVQEPLPLTPHEALTGIEWITGHWVNEGTDAKVDLNYRWTEDGNFIVGDILITAGDTVVMKSFQRIGWDAVEGKYRSWTFDSDGGFGEGLWHATPDGWTLQSKAISPDGIRGTAVTKIATDGKDRFEVFGLHRVTDGIEEPDYQYTVVRRPPEPGK
jgi:ketosteroid isomerase-like protein